MRRLGYVLAFVAGLIVSPFVIAPYFAQAQTTRPDLALFWRAWDLAQEHFVYRDALVSERMVQGAIRGMIDALGDDGHSRYLSPDDVKLERSTLRGRFDGIGAEVNLRNGRPIVVAPIEGSPADQAGLLPGDAILMVDGDDVTSLSLSELVAKVRGPRGSSVRLTVQHPGETSPVDLSVTREEVRVRAASWALVPGTSVAHVRLNRFGRGASQELIEALGAAKDAGATAYVFDLRNNPGGILNESVSVASQFLKDGDVLLEEDEKGERKSFPVEPGGAATDVPLVLLINRGSASASEIVAGAIQDAGRAQLVGERTFGTGTVLTPFDLDDGSQIYLGTGQWLTPNGRVIRKVGVKPDVTVQLSADARPLSPREERSMSVDDFWRANDTQLARAVELLRAFRDELAPAA